MEKSNLTAEEARRLFLYDETTGLIYWLVSPSPKVLVGEVAGSLSDKGYVVVCYRGRRHLGHRLAWLIKYGAWPNSDLDHKNLDRADNAIANLRLAGKKGNAANVRAHKDNKNGLKGVSYHARSKRFRAVICVHGKARHIGLFDTAEAAHLAYCEAAQTTFQDFWRGA
jgi:hypothetical protein